MILNVKINTEETVEESDFITPAQEGNVGLDLKAREGFAKGLAREIGLKDKPFEEKKVPIEKIRHFYFGSIDYIQYDTNIQVDPQSVDLVYRPKGLGSDETEPAMVQDENGPYFTLLFPRSSVSKYNLQLANSVGVIDRSYRGNLILRFNYLFQPFDLKTDGKRFFSFVNTNKIYQIGDKICQLVVSKEIYPTFSVQNELTQTKRGSNGFGSTGV